MRARLGLATATPRPCFLGRQCPRKHGLAPERWGWTWGDRALATPQRACGPGRRRASGRFGASPSIGSSATPGWEPRPLGTGQSRVPTARLAGRGPALCRRSLPRLSPPSPEALLVAISDLGSRISGLGCVPRPHPAWGWQGTQPLTGLEPAWQRTRRQGLSSAGNRKRVWGAEPQPLPGCGSEGQARSLALPARVCRVTPLGRLPP